MTRNRIEKGSTLTKLAHVTDLSQVKLGTSQSDYLWALNVSESVGYKLSDLAHKLSLW